MKLLCSAAVLIAVFVTGCGGTSVPGDPSNTPTESAPASSQAPGEPSPEQPRPRITPAPKPPDPNPPGALGSPINYDSTQLGAGDRVASEVQGSVERNLNENTQGLGCPQPRCGITVVIDGSESDCAKSITPPLEVRRGGVVTIGTGPCPDYGEPPEEPPEEDVPSPEN